MQQEIGSSDSGWFEDQKYIEFVKFVFLVRETKNQFCRKIHSKFHVTGNSQINESSQDTRNGRPLLYIVLFSKLIPKCTYLTNIFYTSKLVSFLLDPDSDLLELTKNEISSFMTWCMTNL